MRMVRKVTAALLMVGVAVVCAGCGQRSLPGAAVEPIAQAPPLPERTIRVLCYHNLVDEAKNLYDTSVADFRAQLDYLRDEGFQTISCADLAAYLDGSSDIPERSVIITFDDGNKSVLTRLPPILQEYGFSATLFLITGAMGGGNITWDEALALAAEGFELGSHTVGHANLTKKQKDESDAAYRERIEREIVSSFETLEEKTGVAPVALAYPYGNYDAQVMAIAEAAGFQLAFSIDRGAVGRDSHRFNLPRRMVVNGTSMTTFKRALACEPLYLTAMDPPVGTRIAGTDYTMSAQVGPQEAGGTVQGEAGKASAVEYDAQSRMVTLAGKLQRGANNVSLTFPGPPLREASWIVVCDP